LVLHAIVHAADLHDRDGGVLLMATLVGLFPFLRKLCADTSYQGSVFQSALRRVLRQVDLQIVKRSAGPARQGEAGEQRASHAIKQFRRRQGSVGK
jgi:hypothetical protein